MSITVFLDMDDVMCDFVGAAAVCHGITKDQLNQHRRPGEWPINHAIARAKGLESYTLSFNEFWEPMDKIGPSFWENLHPHPWLHELLEMVVRHEYYYLTTPTRLHGYEGKAKWVVRYFGVSFLQKLIPTEAKHLLAAPGRILIDDRPENIKEFEKHGGHGILFPITGNCLHEYSCDPMTYVREKFKRLVEKLSCI